MGVTTILVTHDQTEATTMADRVVAANGGRVERKAPPMTSLRASGHLVASFIGSPPINLFEGEADGTATVARGKSCSLTMHGAVVLGIRRRACR
jgi:inositol-phosphate transport system ATP-binding protein